MSVGPAVVCFMLYVLTMGVFLHAIGKKRTFMVVFVLEDKRFWAIFLFVAILSVLLFAYMATNIQVKS